MPDTEHDDTVATPDHDGERETPAGGDVCGYPVDRTADDWPDAADAADAADDGAPAHATANDADDGGDA